ncbi:DUF6364 family protein [Cyclobacterium xiamenense]|uniref:DUF6364 family protein n=1 Tax=Cyclobacterium xiamenense TaxID=1297121 RepID=UPI0012B8DB0A|nr:DUF6364 family protein [Cyclobacterium xiamenense]
MHTKLTLSIEKVIIKTAKDYAKEKGQSLSDLVENYFKLIAISRKKIQPNQLSPRIQRLRGIIQVDSDFNYKEVLNEELSKQHGR